MCLAQSRLLNMLYARDSLRRNDREPFKEEVSRVSEDNQGFSGETKAGTVASVLEESSRGTAETLRD